MKEVFRWAGTLVMAAAIALLFRGFIFELVLVQGESMEDTIYHNQRLVVSKLEYYFFPPKRGDIVVLQYREGPHRKSQLYENFPVLKKIIPDIHEVDYIKRVIGLPGEEVDLRDGYVYVNGSRLEETYTRNLTYPLDISFPVSVPQGSVFVLGDNRENSSDSRSIGFIDYGRIKGRAVFRILPVTDLGTIY